MNQPIRIRQWLVGKNQPLTLLSGPCVIEGEDHALACAEQLVQIASTRNIQLIYKSSYDKANRTSFHSFRGPGLQEGLRILAKVRDTFGIPVLTDVHSVEEAQAAAEVCEVIQIPAFLCRQTDLITAAADTGAVVNVKKGQFMAPWDMRHVVEKITSRGNRRIILTDRGTSFGYNNLVTDFRAIPIMEEFGFPVCYDASHSVQLPGGQGTHSGGDRRFIPTLSRAAIAAGASVLFLESHPHPEKAKSDAASVFPLDELPSLLDHLLQIYSCVNGALPVSV